MSNSLHRLVGAVVVRGYGRAGRKGLARGGRVRIEGLRPPVCCRAVCGACVSLCLPARSWCRSVGSGFRGRGVPAASNGCGLLCRGFWTRVRSVGGRVAGRGYGRPQAAGILVWGTRVVCCGSCGLYGFGPHCEGFAACDAFVAPWDGYPFRDYYVVVFGWGFAALPGVWVDPASWFGCAAFSGNDDCHKVHRPMFRGRSRHALGVTACVGAAEGSHPVVWAVSAGGRTNTQRDARPSLTPHHPQRGVGLDSRSLV